MKINEGITLLVIDDKTDNMAKLSAVVKDALPGTVILTAENGPAGIRLATAEDPDVILLNIVLPGMDSFAVCRRLKTDERLKDIPVVFLTALRTESAARFKALEVGADGFLPQPLDLAELTAQLRAMTKVKAADRQRHSEIAQLETLVTERTREVRQSAERFQIAKEASLNGFLTFQAERDNCGRIVDFVFTDINTNAARMLQMDRGDLIGKRMCKILPINRTGGFFEKYKHVVETGAPVEEEFFLPETHVPAAWHYHQVVRLGDGIAIFHRDISKQKMRDQEHRSSMPQDRNHETVLVVDDEGALLKLTRKMLAGLGYHALAATDTASALTLAWKRKEPIDLLMTDVIMPGMIGRDLGGRIKMVYPDLKILFMSGYTADVIARRGILEKGMHFIQKPFSWGELAAKVRQALSE